MPEKLPHTAASFPQPITPAAFSHLFSCAINPSNHLRRYLAHQSGDTARHCATRHIRADQGRHRVSCATAPQAERRGALARRRPARTCPESSSVLGVNPSSTAILRRHRDAHTLRASTDLHHHALTPVELDKPGFLTAAPAGGTRSRYITFLRKPNRSRCLARLRLHRLYLQRALRFLHRESSRAPAPRLHLLRRTAVPRSLASHSVDSSLQQGPASGSADRSQCGDVDGQQIR